MMAAWSHTWSHVSELSPGQLGVNIGVSLAIVIGAWAIQKLVKIWARRAGDMIPEPEGDETHVRSRRVARFTWLFLEVGLAAAAVFGLSYVWGFDLGGWLSRGIGEQLLHTLMGLGVIIVATFVAVEISTVLIHRLLSTLARDAVDIRRAAQLNTLRPVLKGVAQTAIIITGVLMLLSEMDIQIGPLLAGAGVVGVAVGFGAQTLVKDFLTGIFLIVEDIVSVGDIVRIGDDAGLVEQMTVRTIRLRSMDGVLHVFPYGEAQVIHNLTKNFSAYVFDLEISYESDIDRAMEVMRAVGEELQTDPDFASLILEPIDVLGVDSLGSSGIIIKARIRTEPLQQWTVGREYNKRIKKAFDAAGVSIPYPHMHLVYTPPKDETKAKGKTKG